MDATSFQFKMTMPGDERLVDAVRVLTAHAAKYAELSDDAARTFVDDVLTAATVSAHAAGGADGVVELRFDRTVDRLDVTIEWEGRAPSAAQRSAAKAGEWSHQGRRQRCLISHRASL